MSDLASYCKIYKYGDYMRMLGVGLTNKMFEDAKECYKTLAFMIENNEFFQIYLIPHMDAWFDIHIRLHEDRMYLDYSFKKETLDDIRQWKSGQ